MYKWKWMEFRLQTQSISINTLLQHNIVISQVWNQFWFLRNKRNCLWRSVCEPEIYQNEVDNLGIICYCCIAERSWIMWQPTHHDISSGILCCTTAASSIGLDIKFCQYRRRYGATIINLFQIIWIECFRFAIFEYHNCKIKSDVPPSSLTSIPSNTTIKLFISFKYQWAMQSIYLLPKGIIYFQIYTVL